LVSGAWGNAPNPAPGSAQGIEAEIPQTLPRGGKVEELERIARFPAPAPEMRPHYPDTSWYGGIAVPHRYNARILPKAAKYGMPMLPGRFYPGGFKTVPMDSFSAEAVRELKFPNSSGIYFGGSVMREVYDFLKKTQTYYLATVEGDQPRVRPFGTINLFEGKLYIQTGKAKDVSKQIAANPKVELCAFDGGTWIRIQALAVGDDRREARKHMLDAYPALRDRYAEDDGNTQVLYLKDAVATFSEFGKEPRVVRF
jgi:uncharacterized pyridoxamine 5'-phosphate oxidase family protein